MVIIGRVVVFVSLVLMARVSGGNDGGGRVGDVGCGCDGSGGVGGCGRGGKSES